MSYPNYFQSFDINKMLEDYPLGDELLQRFEGMSKAELKKLQNERFLDVMEKAWTIPFYQRIWGGCWC